MKTYRPILEEGLAKRSDGKTLKDFEIQATGTVYLTPDVRTALDALKPGIALYVGGMGAKDKNFHKDKMIASGYADEANRIQELYLSGRKDEAAAVVPDDFVEERALVGPPERIKEKWKAWADSGMTGITLMHPSEEVVELMAKIAL